MNKTKLSVIVPVFNLEKYVTPCIESLVLQQTNFDFEVIAVDDCSTDTSWTLLQKLQSRYPGTLRCIKNITNQGLAKTIHTLMTQVNGEYIAYLDGDDLALPGKLQKQVVYLDSHPKCSVVYTETDVFDSDTDKTLWTYVKDYYNRQYIPEHAGLEHLIQYGMFMHIGSVMIRNHPDLLNTADQENRIILDHPWLVLNQGYLKGYIDFINEPLNRYRMHASSFGAQNRQSEDRRIQVLKEQLHVCDLAAKQGLDTARVNQGKWHYHYATALFFLKQNKIDLFRKYIELSTDKKWFIHQRHQSFWRYRNEPDKARELINT